MTINRIKEFQNHMTTDRSEFVIDGDCIVRFVGISNDIIIPEGIVRIEDNAFLGCSTIKSVTLSDSTKHIGKRAFYGCQNLEKVVLSHGLEYIAAQAFDQCKNLLIVICHSKVLNHIGEYAFDNSFLRRQAGYLAFNQILFAIVLEHFSEECLLIPDGIQKIVDNLYINLGDKDSYVKRIVFPDSLSEIGERAFDCLPNITSIDLGRGVYKIGKNAFMPKKKVHVSGGDNLMFSDAAFLTYAFLYPGLKNIPCLLEDRKAIVKQGTILLADKSFDKKDVDIVQIPESVTYTSNVSFGKGVEIETPFYSFAYLFANSNNIPTRITTGDLGKHDRNNVMYARCIEERRYDSVKTVILSRESIGDPLIDELLQRCRNVTRYELSQNEDNGYFTFDGVLYYKNRIAKFPPGKRGKYIIPEWVTGIGYYAFSDSQVSSVIIPDSLRAIDEHAFSDCMRLTSLHIPKGVIRIGDQGNESPIVNCPSLEAITVDKENPHYYSFDGVLYSNYDNLLLSYPAQNKGAFITPSFIAGYADYAFCGCADLTDIMISPQISYIGESAFEGCTSLERIIIPESVKRIGKNAFRGCRNLTIEVEERSYAHQYAENNGVRYIARTQV